jgi:hypothetical protein
MSQFIHRLLAYRWIALVIVVAVLILPQFGGAAPDPAKKKPKPDLIFQLVSANPCLANASGTGQIFKQGDVEKLVLTIQGLPPTTEFDTFIIQQPVNPFGLSWYQGDISTDKKGSGTQDYLGRFSIETFIVGIGDNVPAPVVHPDGPFPDASSSDATNPVHTFHVGVWFNSPADAANAGCPDTVTPFNGDHTAGIQILHTVDVDGRGPLAQIQ